jgi:hypothetical protein
MFPVKALVCLTGVGIIKAGENQSKRAEQTPKPLYPPLPFGYIPCNPAYEEERRRAIAKAVRATELKFKLVGILVYAIVVFLLGAMVVGFIIDTFGLLPDYQPPS